MGIPRDPKATLKWVDPEEGVTYEFRYLLGKYQDEFFDLKKESEDRVKPFLAAAEKLIAQESKGKRWKKGEKREAVSAKAAVLAEEDLGSNEKASLDYSRRLIDIFLVGWSHPKKKLPAFPEEHPSALFDFITAGKLSGAVSEKLGELCGLTVEDSKN